MLYALLLGVGLLAAVVYVLVIFREVPGAFHERVGELEQLPADVGEWKSDDGSDEARSARREGLQRETRTFLEVGGGAFGSDRLLLQVRYRSLETGRIERVEPDVKLTRRRRRG